MQKVGGYGNLRTKKVKFEENSKRGHKEIQKQFKKSVRRSRSENTVGARKQKVTFGIIQEEEEEYSDYESPKGRIGANTRGGNQGNMRKQNVRMKHQKMNDSKRQIRGKKVGKERKQGRKEVSYFYDKHGRKKEIETGKTGGRRPYSAGNQNSRANSRNTRRMSKKQEQAMNERKRQEIENMYLESFKNSSNKKSTTQLKRKGSRPGLRNTNATGFNRKSGSEGNLNFGARGHGQNERMRLKATPKMRKHAPKMDSKFRNMSKDRETGRSGGKLVGRNRNEKYPVARKEFSENRSVSKNSFKGIGRSRSKQNLGRNRTNRKSSSFGFGPCCYCVLGELSNCQNYNNAILMILKYANLKIYITKLINTYINA